MRQIACKIESSSSKMLQIACSMEGSSSQMLQITCKMKGSSSKMLQIACCMEGKWQGRCRGRKTEQIRKKNPQGRGKKNPGAIRHPILQCSCMLSNIFFLWGGISDKIHVKKAVQNFIRPSTGVCCHITTQSMDRLIALLKINQNPKHCQAQKRVFFFQKQYMFFILIPKPVCFRVWLLQVCFDTP